MSSNRTPRVCHIIALVGVVLSAISRADDPPPPQGPTAAPVRQAYVIELSRSSFGKVFFSPTEPREGVQATDRFTVNGSILCKSGVGDRQLSFAVKDAGGKTIYSLPVKTKVETGSTPFGFDWPTSGAPDGDYVARVAIDDPVLGEDAHVEWRIYVRDAASVAAHVESARERVAKVHEAAGEVALPELRQRLALALEALAPFSSSERSLIETDANAAFANGIANKVRALLAFGVGKIDPGNPVDAPNFAFPIKPESAGMMGGVVLGDAVDSVDRLAAFGFGLSPHVKGVAPSGPGAPPIPVMVWFPSETGPAAARSPEALRAVCAGDRVAALSLWTNPKAAPAGAESLAEFREYLSTAYRDRIELGRAWKRNLPSIQKAEFVPKSTNHAYQHDVQAFQRKRLTEWISLQLRHASADIGSVPPTVTFTDSIFTPGEARTQPDAEAIAGALGIVSAGTAGPLADARYAQRFPGAQMMYALLRAFVPDRPLVVLQSIDYTPSDRFRLDSAAHLRTAAIEAAIEGVSALAVDFPRLADPISGAPEAVSGFAGALRDLRRVEDAVSAIRAAEAPVAIVWSESSLLLDNGAAYLRALAQAYEGCSFGGHKVGFITERQLAEGRWHSVKVVVLPQVAALGNEARAGLESLIASGASVIRTETGPMYDERGRTTGHVLSVGPKSLLIRGRGEAREYLDALDALNARGVLPDVPRAVTVNGYPIEGVKTICVETAAARWLYIVNLRKEAVDCRFTQHVGIAVDALSGRPVSFPCTIEPLSPILARMAPKPAA